MLCVKEELYEYKLNSDSTQQGQRASILGGGGSEEGAATSGCGIQKTSWGNQPLNGVLKDGRDVNMQQWVGDGCERGKDELKQQIKAWKSCDVYGEQQVA